MLFWIVYPDFRAKTGKCDFVVVHLALEGRLLAFRISGGVLLLLEVHLVHMAYGVTKHRSRQSRGEVRLMTANFERGYAALQIYRYINVVFVIFPQRNIVFHKQGNESAVSSDNVTI